MDGVWGSVLASLRTCFSQNTHKTWFKPLRPLRIEGRSLYLGCPNRFFLAWVRENYLAAIQAALAEADGPSSGVDAVQLEVAPVPAGPAPEPGAAARQYELPRLEVHQRAPLRFNQRFTFDRFVVGTANQYAYSVSLALATDQGLNTDSLFLFSGPGLGKSHLSQAIGHYILGQEPKKKVYYLTAEDFTNEFVFSLKNNSIEGFKKKYRQGCDVLVLEEINFLSGKEKVQAELSFTLDCLLDYNKKIVFTSSRLPKDVPRLQRQLVSRLNNSLISTIEPPDYETRCRILQAKARENNLGVSDEVLDFLARRLTRDVRQMESCLFSLGAKSKLLSRPLDLSLAREALGELIEEENGLEPESILRLVCRYYHLSLEDLRSRSRRRNVVLPRNVAIYLCRRLTDLSLEAIGQTLGRNHSTVLYALNVIEQRSRKDPKLKGQIEFLTDQLSPCRPR